MVTRPKLAREQRYRELIQVAALIVEATNEHPGEWHAIVDGTLFTGADRESVVRRLLEAGKDPVLTAIAPVPVPEQTAYNVCGH